MNEIRLGQPLKLGHYTITPVERVILHTGAGRYGRWVYATLEPVAVLVDSPQGRVMLDLDGNPLPTEAWPLPA